jgi:L-amino acid N-acyltransferase YncA
MPFILNFIEYPQPEGLFCYARVPWDSDLFGFPIYELRITHAGAGDMAKALQEWLASLPATQNCLVYNKVNTAHVSLLGAVTECGFYPMETILDLSARLVSALPPLAWPFDSLVLRHANREDLTAISRIARNSFRTDRFHLDPNLDPERADERYARWVARAFDDGEIVLALEDRRAQRLVGFYHLRETVRATVDLALLAIDPACHRRGLGTAMSRAAMELCRMRGYRSIVTRVSTNNLASLNLHTRLGFSIVGAVMTMHWFRPGEADRDHKGC